MSVACVDWVLYNNAMESLGLSLARALHVEGHPVTRGKYENDNSWVMLPEVPRGSRVAVLDSSYRGVNDALVDTCLTLDGCRRAGMREVVLLMAHLPYARSDVHQPRHSYALPLVLSLLQVAGATSIVTVDLHAPQTCGFSRVPMREVTAVPLFADHARRMAIENPVVVSPDLGGTKRAERLARELGVGLAIMKKRRDTTASPHVRELCGGSIEGKGAILYDEEVITGASKCLIARQLLDLGAGSVYGFFTHADLTDEQSYARLLDSDFCHIAVTDTTPVEERIARWGRNPRFVVLSVADTLAGALVT